MKLFDKSFSVIALAVLAILGVFTTLLWGKIDNLLLDKRDIEKEISVLKDNISREKEYHLFDEAKNPTTVASSQKDILDNLTLELDKKTSEIESLKADIYKLSNYKSEVDALKNEIKTLKVGNTASHVNEKLDQKYEDLSQKLSDSQKENLELKKQIALHQRENNPTPAQIYPSKKRWTLSHNVLFHLGQSRLTQDGLNSLKNISTELLNLQKKNEHNKNFMIEVAGHSDSIKIKDPNLTNRYLSAKRALVVIRFLENNGINPKNLVASAWGEHHPRYKTPSKNRRIEILVSY